MPKLIHCEERHIGQIIINFTLGSWEAINRNRLSVLTFCASNPEWKDGLVRGSFEDLTMRLDDSRFLSAFPDTIENVRQSDHFSINPYCWPQDNKINQPPEKRFQRVLSEVLGYSLRNKASPMVVSFLGTGPKLFQTFDEHAHTLLRTVHDVTRQDARGFLELIVMVEGDKNDQAKHPAYQALLRTFESQSYMEPFPTISRTEVSGTKIPNLCPTLIK